MIWRMWTKAFWHATIPSEIENSIERIIHPPDYYIHLFSLRPMEAQAEVKNNRIWANSMALKALHEVSIA